MRNTIFKFPFEIVDKLVLTMPKGAKVLSVQMQSNQPCLWAIVDKGAPMETREFRLAGTGHDLPDDAILNTMKFIGTFQMYGGSLIFHLFECERS